MAALASLRAAGAPCTALPTRAEGDPTRTAHPGPHAVASYRPALDTRQVRSFTHFRQSLD